MRPQITTTTTLMTKPKMVTTIMSRTRTRQQLLERSANTRRRGGEAALRRTQVYHQGADAKNPELNAAKRAQKHMHKLMAGLDLRADIKIDVLNRLLLELTRQARPRGRDKYQINRIRSEILLNTEY